MPNSADVYAHLRRLFSKWAIPPWLLLAWEYSGHLSTLDWLRERITAGASHVVPFLRQWHSESIPVIGFLWLGWLVLRPPKSAAATIPAERDEPPPPTPVLTYEERDEIQALRTFWNRYFQPAAQSCSSLFRIVYAKYIEDKIYWGELTHPKIDRLLKAMLAMSEAVAPDTTFRLLQVQRRQDEAYGAYAGAAYWLAKIAAMEKIDLTERDTGGELTRWRELHEKFREKLGELVERPAQSGLVVRVSQPDDALMRLLHPEPRALNSAPPKLTIRQVAYKEDDDWPEIQFTVINEGGSTATIGKSAVTAWVHTRNVAFPPVPPYEGPPIDIPNEMGPGMEKRVTYRDSSEDFSLVVGDVAKDMVQTMLLGHIRYSDAYGNEHHMGFCRRRIENTNNFEPVDNPDYEYSY